MSFLFLAKFLALLGMGYGVFTAWLLASVS
jgi:hypothetical protein